MPKKDSMERQLADALKRLVLTQPFEKITIADLVEETGVARSTFYNHFQDKYDLLEWILRTEVLSPVRILAQNDMLRESIVLFFASMQKEQAFYQRVYRLTGQNSFEEMLTKGIKDILFEHLSAKINPTRPHAFWETPELLATFYSGALYYAFFVWMEVGMPYSPREIGDAYETLTTTSMEEVIRRLE